MARSRKTLGRFKNMLFNTDTSIENNRSKSPDPNGTNTRPAYTIKGPFDCS